MAGIDVQEFERQFQRAAFDLEGFDGKRQQYDGVFAAGKQQGRVLGIGNHFADDVDRLGFEPVEVVVFGWTFFLSLQSWAIVDTLVRPSEKGKEWFVCCKDVFVSIARVCFQTAFAL